MIEKFEHIYKGFGSYGPPSKCIIEIFSDDGDNFICFINIGEGTSVTNASEILATEIVEKYNFNPSECYFYETYQEYDFETFDQIYYDWIKRDIKWIASNPQWVPASSEIKNLFLN